MTHAGELPSALRIPETLERLTDAARHAARDQTADPGLVEDAVSEAIGALVAALRRPEGPPPVTWDRYVRTAATRYASRQDARAKKAQPMGWGGSELRGFGVRDARGGRGRVEAALPGAFASIGSAIAIEDRFQRVLDRCTPLERELLLGKYVFDQSTAELAREHDMTAKAVDNVLNRARVRLRAMHHGETAD